MVWCHAGFKGNFLYPDRIGITPTFLRATTDLREVSEAKRSQTTELFSRPTEVNPNALNHLSGTGYFILIRIIVVSFISFDSELNFVGRDDANGKSSHLIVLASKNLTNAGIASS